MKHCILVIGLVLLIKCVTTLDSFGQFPNFVSYGQDNGLPQGYVYTISQGQKGYLWLGTGDGFVKFDGHHFNVYGIKDNLAEDFVTTSLVDSKGNLWVGHYQGGISKYLEQENRFQKINTKTALKSRINQIFEGSDGSIWFVTQNKGLIRIHDEQIEIIENETSTLFYTITEGKNNELLIGSNNGLLTCEVINSRLKIKGSPKFTNQKINTIIQNKSGAGYWIGTNNHGLIFYDPEGKNTYLTTENGLSSNRIKCIYQNNHELWIGTRTKGVNLLLLDTLNQITNITVYTNQNNLPDNHILSIASDKENNIWVGTNGGGIARYTGEKFSINKDHLPSQLINVIYKDSLGNSWYGTEKGLVKIKYTHDSKNIIENYNVKLGLDSVSVSTVLKDLHSNMWIGYKEDGLFVINSQEDSIVNLYERDDFDSRMINDLTLDKNGDIWIATRLNGVYHYNIKMDTFRRYSTNEGFLHNNISDLYCDSKGKIWIASSSPGLSYFEDEVFHFLNDYDNIKGVKFNCITEDSLGNIWLGSDGKGLYMYNGENFINYTTESGLLSNYIYLIGSDHHNNIWIGSRNGLTRYKSSSGNFEQFSSKIQGLSDIETSTNAYFLDNQGNVWFGLNQGVLRYDPLQDKINTVKPNIYITDLYVFDNKIPLKPNLKLKPGQYRMRFDFLGISFKEPDKIKYQYMLEGHDLEWSEVTGVPIARYPRVEDGTYTLKVKAANSDGIWSNEMASFTFEITKPFWKKSWFYVVLGILALGSVYVYNKIRLRNLILRNKDLEEKVSIRTSELNQEKEKLEKANTQLDHQKQEIETAYQKLVELEKFKETLTNMIVHDLKNPLNAVISLSEESPLIQQAGRQMLHMVTNILDISKFEEADMHLNIKVYYVNKLIDKALQQISLFAQQNGLMFKKNIPNKLLIKADQELIIRVLVNLLTNAIKYSQAGSTITISCEIIPRAEKEWVKISIQDMGCGIAKDDLPYVFDKFKQFASKDLGKTKSTGLGLTFCKLTVEAHNGEIGVVSELGKGSTFHFCLEKTTKAAFVNNQNTNEPTSDEDFLYTQEDILLSDGDKTQLSQIVERFSHLEIYDTSENMDLLSQVKPTSKEVEKWKNEMEQSLLSFNQNRYKELINLVSD